MAHAKKCQFRRSGKYSCAANAVRKFSVGDDAVNLCPTHTKVSKELKFVSGDGEKIKNKTTKKQSKKKKNSVVKTTAKKSQPKKNPVVKTAAKKSVKKPTVKKSKKN